MQLLFVRRVTLTETLISFIFEGVGMCGKLYIKLVIMFNDRLRVNRTITLFIDTF